MSWKGGPFYTDNDITLKGQFVSDGEAQTPDAASALIEVWKKGTSTVYLASTAASITGTTIYHKLADVPVGEYVAYLTAKFNSGVDERTGEIKFSVKSKEGVW